MLRSLRHSHHTLRLRYDYDKMQVVFEKDHTLKILILHVTTYGVVMFCILKMIMKALEALGHSSSKYSFVSPRPRVHPSKDPNAPLSAKVASENGGPRGRPKKFARTGITSTKSST
ncbi:hypothetical protein VNO77_43604 [Canavalia gladiata]|uniref:Uncharacterized protein n=1 Tax=Canavalia gladiata TaxID=3824 RepID=A0AAN9JY24_CANGL